VRTDIEASLTPNPWQINGNLPNAWGRTKLFRTTLETFKGARSRARGLIMRPGFYFHGFAG